MEDMGHKGANADDSSGETEVSDICGEIKDVKVIQSTLLGQAQNFLTYVVKCDTI